MSLTALNWKKLPAKPVSGSTLSYYLNNIYDMLTGSLYFDGSARVTGSNSAWTGLGRFITGSGTGSNTEAVYCYPPTTTVMSQSVIFAGVSTNGAATPRTSVSMVTDSHTIGVSDLNIACVKNATASYTNWTGSAPFGSGSNSTGYACIITGSVITAGTIQKMTIYESQEAIAIVLTNNNGTLNYCAVAGALIDPEQTTTSIDAELDNRIYGVTTTSDYDRLISNWAGMSTASIFYSTTTPAGSGGHPQGPFYHSSIVFSTSYPDQKFVTFNPQSSTTRRTVITFYSNATSAMVYQTYVGNFGFTTISGKFTKLPVICLDANSGYFVGRIREITITKQIPANQIIRDASTNIVGFTLAGSEIALSDTLLLNA